MPTSVTRRPSRAEVPPGRPGGRRAEVAGPRLTLTVHVDPDAGPCPADRHQLRRWVRAAIPADSELSLRLVTPAEARALNIRFRGRRYVPNVLTFAYDPPPRPGRGRAARGPVRADVVVCLARAAREAREQGKPLRDHLAHLVVHGVLHAHGMDHLEPSDAARMQSRESAVLARFGIPDPWR